MKKKQNARIANNKLSRAIVGRLLSPTVWVTREYTRQDGLTEVIPTAIPNIRSKYAILLLIEFSKVQNSIGQVSGVHYRHFCDILGCSKQSFYNALEELVRTEYLIATPSPNGYWTIFILNNVFTNARNDRQGYINTNLIVFESQEFRSCTATQIRIILYILLNKKRYEQYVVYPDTILKKLHIKSLAVLREALAKLHSLFNINTRKGKQGELIVIQDTVLSTATSTHTELYNYIIHTLRVHLEERHHRTNVAHNVLHDLAVLMCGYAKRISCCRLFRMWGDYVDSLHGDIEPPLFNSIVQKNL